MGHEIFCYFITSLAMVTLPKFQNHRLIKEVEPRTSYIEITNIQVLGENFNSKSIVYLILS